jgi:HTH-type transcriptional regulator/antitoxin HipB
MQEIAPTIDLQLPEKLRDPNYRRAFFLAEASARIAKQIISLRKMRGFTQAELAERAEMRQPAISRAERSDYQNWSFSTLRRIADALDARLRVSIEPVEKVLVEYSQPHSSRQNLSASIEYALYSPRQAMQHRTLEGWHVSGQSFSASINPAISASSAMGRASTTPRQFQ